jgi:Sel1 repeat-containing protein
MLRISGPAGVRLLAALLLLTSAAAAQTPAPPLNANELRKELSSMTPSQLSEVRSRAEGGSARDQFRIGLAYEYGLAGVMRDLAEALRWHKRAAQQGIGLIESWVGDFYYDGVGVDVDHREALSWYHRASDHGYPLATRFIGDFTLYGQGTAANQTEAAGWYAKAAAMGDATARSRLALLTPTCMDDFCATLRTLLISRDNGFRDLRGERRQEPIRDVFDVTLKPMGADDCQVTGADQLLRLGPGYECVFATPYAQLAQRVRSSLPNGWATESPAPDVLQAGPDPDEPVVILSGFWLRVVAPYR